MKTIGYKIKITVLILAMILLASCSVNIPLYSVMEPVFYKYLVPDITKAVTKYTDEKLKSSLNNKNTNEKEKEANQMKEKPVIKEKQKHYLFSFGTTEAYLASADKEENKVGEVGS